MLPPISSAAPPVAKIKADVPAAAVDIPTRANVARPAMMVSCGVTINVAPKERGVSVDDNGYGREVSGFLGLTFTLVAIHPSSRRPKRGFWPESPRPPVEVRKANQLSALPQAGPRTRPLPRLVRRVMPDCETNRYSQSTTVVSTAAAEENRGEFFGWAQGTPWSFDAVLNHISRVP